MVLTIISHTPHYKKDGLNLGWGPTINEINRLSSLFSKVYHIAPLHSETCPKSAERYISSKIKYIPIIPTGGVGLFNKLNVLFKLPFNFWRIHKICIKSDWVHFRAPTNLGLYVLPYLSIFSNKKRWIKYGGSWNQKDIPFTYKLQRLWLLHNIQNSKVIISGKWPNQKKHLLTFDNPCLSKSEILIARNRFIQKEYFSKLSICFVGHMDNNKGAGILLESLNNMDLRTFNNIYFVGDGPYRHIYEKKSKKNKSKNNIYFTGELSRELLNKIYAESHILILPTLSEGFPKVISESLARLRPIIIFEEIKHILDNRNGIFICKRNKRNIDKTINYIFKNYKKIQREISKNNFYTKDNFKKELLELTNNEFRN